MKINKLSWCLVLLSVASTCFAQVMYTINDLGTLGGSFSGGNSLNNSGQVVGCSRVRSWSNRVPRSIRRAAATKGFFSGSAISFRKALSLPLPETSVDW